MKHKHNKNERKGYIQIFNFLSLHSFKLVRQNKFLF